MIIICPQHDHEGQSNQHNSNKSLSPQHNKIGFPEHQAKAEQCQGPELSASTEAVKGHGWKQLQLGGWKAGTSELSSAFIQTQMEHQVREGSVQPAKRLHWVQRGQKKKLLTGVCKEKVAGFLYFIVHQFFLLLRFLSPPSVGKEHVFPWPNSILFCCVRKQNEKGSSSPLGRKRDPR